MNAYSSFIHNSEKLGTAQVLSTLSWIPLSGKKKPTLSTHNNLDESPKNYVD